MKKVLLSAIIGLLTASIMLASCAVPDEAEKKAAQADARAKLAAVKEEPKKEAETETEKHSEEASVTKDFQAVNESIKGKLAEKEQQVKSLTAELEKTKAKLGEKTSEADSLRETLNIARLEKPDSQTLKDLQKFKDQLLARNHEVKQAEAKSENLQEQIRRLQEQAANDEGQMELLRKTLAERDDVSEQVKAMATELKERDEAIEQRDGEIVALKDELTEARLEKERLKSAAARIAETHAPVNNPDMETPISGKDDFSSISYLHVILGVLVAAIAVVVMRKKPSA